jgi:hypothetical protein
MILETPTFMEKEKYVDRKVALGDKPLLSWSEMTRGLVSSFDVVNVNVDDDDGCSKSIVNGDMGK